MRRVLGSFGWFGPLVPIAVIVLLTWVIAACWTHYRAVREMHDELEWARNNPRSIRNPHSGVGKYADPGVDPEHATDLQRACDCGVDRP